MYLVVEKALGILREKFTSETDCNFESVYYVMNIAHVGLLLCDEEPDNQHSDARKIWGKVRDDLSTLLKQVKKRPLKGKQERYIDDVVETYKKLYEVILEKERFEL